MQTPWFSCLFHFRGMFLGVDGHGALQTLPLHLAFHVVGLGNVPVERPSIGSAAALPY